MDVLFVINYHRCIHEIILNIGLINHVEQYEPTREGMTEVISIDQKYQSYL